jgi:bifunctional non-homologous end joining protein LigD
VLRFDPIRRTEFELAEHNRVAASLRHYFMKEHHATRHHFDLRLYFNGLLLSWAIPEGPSRCATRRRRAIQVGDHLKKNVDFEGVFPDGRPGAGPTMLWDRGTWRPSSKYSDVEDCVRKGCLHFTIDGEKLKGNWTLIRAEGNNASGDGSEWYLIKDADPYAIDECTPDIVFTAPLSVNLGITLQQVRNSFLAGKAKRPPQSVPLFEL